LIARVVLIGLAFLAFLIANFAGVHYLSLMTDDVNRTRQAKDILWPFEPGLGWEVIEREREIRRAYVAANPDGVLHHRLRMIRAIQVVSMVVAFVVFGSFMVPR
jgi:hypothetical protein